MAYYSAGILICLYPYFICLDAIASDGNDATNGYKGRYSQKPSQYEVVVPLKVTESGEFISHRIPHHYHRSYYGQRSQKDMGPDDKVHYVVPIAGEKHHLELLPSNNIVSPGVVVEIHDNKGISEREMRKLGNTQCHYTGSVRGQEDSRAALSTCYGLSGYIRTKRGYHLIEPAEGHEALSDQEHPHLLYEHKLDPDLNSNNCETSGNLAKILSKRKTTGTTVSDEEKFQKHQNNRTELHIEAMVVIDKTMLNYHKEMDVETYVLTVFNMAHDMYHDASLGTNINLAIVRLVRLEHEESKLNLAMNRDAKKTLEFFRDWQSKINPGDDTHPNHHDVAVLLTRIDICGDDNNCGLLGASTLGGMCDPLNQAVLCEDNGLRLGFVIAHELAHTLSIPHDEVKESGCNASLPDGLFTVMKESIHILTAGWSPCSGKYVKMFIDQGYGECLYDPPTDHSFVMPDILPGVMYGGEFQCRQLVAPNAALCDTGIECDNLICYIEEKGCIETHSPAAPGTSCGEKKWCFHNKCVELGERPGATDGGWGSWSPWSECTRTCGSGVASSERHCNNPVPAYGGRYCIGERKRHKICNTEPCETGQPSFRNVQCAEFNEWIYPEDNKAHIWKSYNMAEENPCILFCVNEGGEVAALLPRVIDGTKCYGGQRDVCIDGICKEIPCDLELESDAVEDWCGVCHGDGTTCNVITGEKFFPQDESDDTKVKFIDIPAESVNIKIEETEPTASKILVKNTANDAEIIDGEKFGVFDVSGTRAWFGHIRMKQEALNVPGPINECWTVYVQPHENVTMKYSFGVKQTTKRDVHFSWDYVDWTKCSASCGPGTEESIPKCMEKTAGLVDDKHCVKSPKPKERIRPCENSPCTPRWMIGDWQKCNCSKKSRLRMVKCIKPAGEGEGESDIIADSNCAKPKPKYKEKCVCQNPDKKDTKRNSGEVNKRSGYSAASNQQSVGLLKRYCEEDQKLNGTKKGTVIDKEDLKEVNLTIHQDFLGPNNKDPCNKENSSTNTIEGKDALKFIEKMEKDLGKDKPKV